MGALGRTFTFCANIPKSERVIRIGLFSSAQLRALFNRLDPSDDLVEGAEFLFAAIESRREIVQGYIR